MPLSKMRKTVISEISVSNDLKGEYEEVCYSLYDTKSVEQHCRLFVELAGDDKVKVTWYPRHNCPDSAIVVSYMTKRKATYHVRGILKCYNPKYGLQTFFYKNILS